MRQPTGRASLSLFPSCAAFGQPMAAARPWQPRCKSSSGLKLVLQKEPVEVLAIDHIEKPPAN